METDNLLRTLGMTLYGLSSCAALWTAAFAFYGLRRERGLPFSFLCGTASLWNFAQFLLIAFHPFVIPGASFLTRALINLSHLSYSLLLPLLYGFSRGDGFRGIRRGRKFVLLGIPVGVNALFWLFPPNEASSIPVINAAIAVQIAYSVMLTVLCVITLVRRSRDPRDYERASIARILVAAFIFSVVFGLYRAGAFRGPSFDPSPVAVAIAVVIVATGYHRLDPFTSVAENENRLRRFEFMADASQEYMSIINRDYRYEAVNAAFCASMKRGREEIVGRSVAELWGPEIFEEAILPPLRSCLAGSSLVFRKRFSFGDAEPRSLEVSYYPFIPPGASEPSHAVVVTKDITDYARKEDELEEARRRAEAANAAKSDFLAAMSHEIRTPINAVMGLTELALRRDLDPELRDDLETVKASSINLLALVNDILDLSRIEAGGMRFESVPFSPRESIERTIKSFKAAVGRKGIDLETSVDERVPPLVLGDPLRFSQVLFNLIGNAVKFTERGGVYVSAAVFARQGDTERVALRVEVRDTGIGIPPDKLESIFNSFSQASEGTSRKYGGSGLGLTISRRIARLIGGDVTVDSVQGSGSSFIFDACFEKAPEDAVAENVVISAVAAETVPAAGTGTVSIPASSILLVEDNPINARVALRFLQSLGRSADCAATGADALRYLGVKRYDIVFMDVELPEMDGLETTRRIRSGEAGESARVVPIVAMTANSGLDARSMCSEAGMDDFLTKPLDFPALESILSRFARGFPYTNAASAGSEFQTFEASERQLLPVLDRKRTLVRLGGDAKLLEELYGILKAEASSRSADALRFAEAGDFKALASLAHQVKGSAASLGAERLAEAARLLQKAGESRDGQTVALALGTFLEAYAMTYKEIPTGS